MGTPPETPVPPSPASGPRPDPSPPGELTGSRHLYQPEPPPPAPPGPERARQRPAPRTEKAGDFIGPYKLLELLGEGGFGCVWAAEQTHPLKRRVALKLLNPGMDTKTVLARFEQERQALALMDHPNIARVLDAGVTAAGDAAGSGGAGRPYFVMELVRGVPITQYCDSAKLTPRQRMQLMQQVARAVQHAHTKGIIHRDIKPGNVLVTLHGDQPVPKVIDFGIAKATTQPLTDKTIYTEFRQLIGTPPYMSPEQAEMSGLDIDTRADVYALGALMYELLTGSPPLDPEALRRAGLAEMYRLIKEVEPPKPSTKVSALRGGTGFQPVMAGAHQDRDENGLPHHRLEAGATKTLAELERLRGAEPGRLSSLLKGEPDWIVMKAMEKDRTRRYETADGLAADIGRFLSGEAVLAGPPSAGYRVKRFVRRNKVGVGAGAAVLVGLSVAVGGLWWGYGTARSALSRERDALMAVQQSNAELASANQQLVARQKVLDERSAVLAEDRRFLVESFIAVLETTDTGIRDVRLDPDGVIRWDHATRGPGFMWFVQQGQDWRTSGLIVNCAMLMRGYVESALDRERTIREELESRAIELEKEVKRARLAEARVEFNRFVLWRTVPSPEDLAPLEQVVSTREEVLGPTHRDTVEALYLLSIERFARDWDRASLVMMRDAVDRWTRSNQPWDAAALNMHTQFARCSAYLGDIDDAVRLYRLVEANIYDVFERDGPEVMNRVHPPIDGSGPNNIMHPQWIIYDHYDSSEEYNARLPGSDPSYWQAPGAADVQKNASWAVLCEARHRLEGSDSHSRLEIAERLIGIAHNLGLHGPGAKSEFWRLQAAIECMKGNFALGASHARWVIERLDPTDFAARAILAWALSRLGSQAAACEELSIVRPVDSGPDSWRIPGFSSTRHWLRIAEGATSSASHSAGDSRP